MTKHIEMAHPGLPGTKPVKTTEEAFAQVWSRKGWKRVEPAPLPFAPRRESPRRDKKTEG